MSTNCNVYKRFFDFAFGINKDGCPILKKEISTKDVFKFIERMVND